MKIFDTTLTQLERSLDVRLVRHNVLSSNIANVDTPGYKPKDIDFAATMAAISGSTVPNGGPVTLAATAPGHMGVGRVAAPGTGIDMGRPGDASELPLVETGGESPSLDGNRVDLDRTMVAMAENGIQYGASARAATKKLGILKYVSSDGVG
jgi:flagellar basal-body rod protein FlgB